MGSNVGWYGFADVVVFIALIGIPNFDPLLYGFMVFQRTEARLIKNTK